MPFIKKWKFGNHYKNNGNQLTPILPKKKKNLKENLIIPKTMERNKQNPKEKANQKKPKNLQEKQVNQKEKMKKNQQEKQVNRKEKKTRKKKLRKKPPKNLLKIKKKSQKR